MMFTGPCSSVWVQTVPSAPTRTPLRSSVPKHDNSAQGYFVYDSKKSGSITTSHLRFGKNQVVAPYLINKANFIACHNFTFLDKYDMLANLEDGGTFLLTTNFKKDPGLERAASQGSETAYRQEGQILHHRCYQACRGNRSWRPHQHDHADRLLPDLRHPDPERSYQSHQGCNQENLRQERRQGCQHELRRR